VKDFGLEPDYRVEMSQDEEARVIRKWNDERIVKGERPPEPKDFKDHPLDAALEVLRAKLEKREPRVEARLLPAQPKPSEN
jgi:hypothetical protein